jgi:voltage-gated potassium channel Kch
MPCYFRCSKTFPVAPSDLHVNPSSVLILAGYTTGARVFGAAGITIAGAVTGVILAPAALPLVAAGALGSLAGFGAWTAVDKMRDLPIKKTFYRLLEG